MINKNDLRKAIDSIAISNAKRNTIYKAFSNLNSINKEEFDSIKSDISKVVENMLTKDTVGKANGVASLDSNGSVPIEQLGNIDTTLFLIVRELPTTDIKTNKIYLVPNKDDQGNDVYIEYLYVDNVWENLGEFKCTGASTAAAVTFDNAASGMTAITAQAVIDELAAKNKLQDIELSKKTNITDIVQELGENEKKVVSQKAISEEIDKVSIVNCNKLPGYSYTSIFTLQEAISAVPANKRYAAKGITYIDANKKVHLAIFNNIAYGSGWENPENWIDISKELKELKELIDIIQGKRFFTPVSTKGYIDFDNAHNQIIVSQNIYYNFQGELKNVKSGNYTIDLSLLEGINYCALVIDNNILSFKRIDKIANTDIVLATLTCENNSIKSVCHCVVPFRINGATEIETNNSIVRKKSSIVSSVIGEIYKNRIEYKAKKGDILSISLKGNEGLIKGEGQLIVDKSIVIGVISVGGSITVELAQDITYILFQRSAANVIGSGDIELVVDMPSSIDNRISNLEYFNKLIIGNKQSNIVATIKSEVYSNRLKYSARKGDILSISLKGNEGLINGYCQLVADNADNAIVLGTINVGEQIEVTLPNDITYICAQRSAANVIGSGDIELVAEYYDSLNEKVNKNSQKLDELSSKIPSIDVETQIAASSYESTIRAREEYLRDVYKNSGESEHWYGIEWKEESEDNISAINSEGDSSLHSSLPIQNKMRRCIIDNGVVQYYLDANNSELKEDGTPAKLNGIDGNVMVEIPEFFYRAEEEMSNSTRIMRLKISEQGLNGFIFSPKRYTSAYEATIDRSKNRLVSVCTTLFERGTEEIMTEANNYIVGSDKSRGIHKTARRSGFTSNAANYRGGTNDDTLDNETDPSSQNYSRNQLGIPIASVNRTQCRSYVNNLDREFIYQYDTHKVLWMLAMVEFKKKDITKGTGMSIGANVYPNYNAYEAYFSPQGGISCLPCGITNSLGNNTGTVYFRMINVPVEATGTSKSIVYNRWADVWMPCLSYRGVEHWFGHICKIADGVNILCEGTNTYYEGKEGNPNYEYNDVTYWYQKNPYLTNDRGTEKQKLGTFKYMSGTRVITSLLGGSTMHILPILSDVTGYNTNYCDCVEIYHRGGIMYPAYNGRIVSDTIDGANFIVGNNLADNGKPRPSDGTRLDIL